MKNGGVGRWAFRLVTAKEASTFAAIACRGQKPCTQCLSSSLGKDLQANVSQPVARHLIYVFYNWILCPFSNKVVCTDHFHFFFSLSLVLRGLMV
jgi:hypothetical protein